MERSLFDIESVDRLRDASVSEKFVDAEENKMSEVLIGWDIVPPL